MDFKEKMSGAEQKMSLKIKFNCLRTNKILFFAWGQAKL